MPLDKIVSGVYRRVMSKANAQPAPPEPLGKSEAQVTLARFVGQLAIHVAIPVPAADPNIQAQRAIEAKRQQATLGDRWVFHAKGNVTRLDKRDQPRTEIPEFLKRRGVRKIK